MKKTIVLLLIFLLSLSETFAYAIKVYDEYGNRVGTYRKEGENYVLYDFKDNKVEQPEKLLDEVPSQKALTEYSRTYYDENMMPIGTYRSGYYGNNGLYYPRGAFFPSYSWRPSRTPSITCPRARHHSINNNYRGGTVFVDTRYPELRPIHIYQTK